MGATSRPVYCGGIAGVSWPIIAFVVIDVLAEIGMTGAAPMSGEFIIASELITPESAVDFHFEDSPDRGALREARRQAHGSPRQAGARVRHAAAAAFRGRLGRSCPA